MSNEYQGDAIQHTHHNDPDTPLSNSAIEVYDDLIKDPMSVVEALIDALEDKENAEKIGNTIISIENDKHKSVTLLSQLSFDIVGMATDELFKIAERISDEQD